MMSTPLGALPSNSGYYGSLAANRLQTLIGSGSLGKSGSLHSDGALACNGSFVVDGAVKSCDSLVGAGALY